MRFLALLVIAPIGLCQPFGAPSCDHAGNAWEPTFWPSGRHCRVAAKRQGGRMSTVTTIDVHAHMLPEESMRRLAAESPRVAPKLIDERGALIMEIAGRVVQRPMPR